MKQSIIRINNTNNLVEHKTKDLDWAIGINNNDNIKSPKTIADISDYKYDDNGNYILYEGIQYFDDNFEIIIANENYYVAKNKYDSNISELYDEDNSLINIDSNIDNTMTNDTIDWDDEDEDGSIVYDLNKI